MSLFFVGTAIWFLFWVVFLALMRLRVSGDHTPMTLFHCEEIK